MTDMTLFQQGWSPVFKRRGDRPCPEKTILGCLVNIAPAIAGAKIMQLWHGRKVCF
jgi:hypothetical protein